MVTSQHPSIASDSYAATGKPAMTIRLSGKDRHILVESISRDLESIDGALRRHDQSGLLECIHSLKGALFIVGEHSAANDCGMAEQGVQTGGLDKCERDIEYLKSSLRRLLQRYTENS
ncbi:Hpt domain-containing protein [Dyella acidisoli]|uniref:HPt domain-containing protein n=1 Tax=Dyella acidisoli TaxID=1867834 RepID=A0ABQ5XNF2_9GAMM|nr:Hpt domain-containing protein [Dyella acidisoli]GLQ93245.1 hypothetical protein GCM10007901_21960 [Dyella acidisoli]